MDPTKFDDSDEVRKIRDESDVRNDSRDTRYRAEKVQEST
jgi:hypothetical protein